MTIPAVVTIPDLPLGTTITGTELIEAVQTTLGGAATSVQLTLSNVVSNLGGLPTTSVTGQVLQSLGSSFTATWVAPSSFIAVGTGLALSGSTSLTLSLATGAGPSVLGVAATATASPLLIVGTGAQVLRVNDGGTGLAFGAVNLGSSAAVTGILPGANVTAVNLATTGAGGVQGGLPLTSITTIPALSVLANASSGVGNATAVVGTANQLLAVNPAATAVIFSSVSSYIDNAIGSSQGAILYRNAATWVILPAGSTGQLLQTLGAAANPQWVGGMVLLNTLSPNNVATVGDTTSLTSTYRNYMVTFENVVPATTATLQLQIATSGTTFISGGYVAQAQVNVSSVFVTDTSATAIILSGTRATTQIGSTTTYGLFGSISIFNPANAVFRKQIVGDVSFLTPGASGTTTFAQSQIAGYYDGASNAITGLQFAFSAGNIATGTIRVYGLF